MKVSVFTPTHDPKFLSALYESIKGQDFSEWVIVTNGRRFDIGLFQVPLFDGRVRVIHYPGPFSDYVGLLKKVACDNCTGDILLEVDHDDILAPDAIEEVKMAFSDPEIGFAYSNFAEFQGAFERRPKFNLAMGWQYRTTNFKGHLLDEVVSFEPTPASVSRIWYAPNHLRAWRRSVYQKIGGHSSEMRVLDDQDLLARTFLETKMRHIDKCLYFQRVDGENTWLKHNEEIQKNVMPIYGKYIVQMARKWALDNKLFALDFGGGIDNEPGFDSIDLTTGFDLEKTLPFPDNSVGVIRAHDILEHLSDKLAIIKEIHRVLAPGGYLLVKVPCALSQGAYQDPTHKTFYVENSFRYYTEERFARYIGKPVRFQPMSLHTTGKNSDGVAWVVAQLVALKDNRRVPGLIEI